jgi:hypothetical protein
VRRSIRWEAFYWSPGHAPEALEDVEFVHGLLADEGVNEVIEHVTTQLG